MRREPLEEGRDGVVQGHDADFILAQIQVIRAGRLGCPVANCMDYFAFRFM